MTALQEGFDYIGIELETASAEIAEHRVSYIHDKVTNDESAVQSA